MNILSLKEDLSNRLYLTRFRITHKDTNLINKLKFSITLLIIVIIVPFVCLLFINKNIRVNIDNNEKIVEQNSYISMASNGKFKSPINGVITSNYGYRKDPISGIISKHTGVDISGIHHDNIKCITDGIVTFAGSQDGFGNCIEIKHNINGKEIYSFYAHLSKILVTSNEQVKEGQTIAIEGGDPTSDPNPGYSTGHHLHFEIRTSSGYGYDIDPMNYIFLN